MKFVLISEYYFKRKDLICLAKKLKEEEVYNTYVIPMNFENGSRLLGFVKLWNGAEAVVLCGGLGFFEYNVMTALRVDLYVFIAIMCVTLIPLAILCIIGVEGIDIGRFLLRMLKSMQNRKHIVRKENYDAVLKEKQGR